jgi:hypothetical protein
VPNNPILFILGLCTARRSMSSDFSYKHEARHNSTLVVTKMLAEDSDDAVWKMFIDTISTAKAGMS